MNKKISTHHPSTIHLTTRLLLALLFIMLTLTGCRQGSTQKSTGEEEAFSSFTEQCFKDLLLTDSISLHFKLSNPSAYGLEESEPSLGDLSLQAQEEQCDKASELHDQLLKFDRNLLSKDQQLTYDILERKLSETAASREYLLFGMLLGSNGIPSQIPVSLSEYYFDDEEDIRTYLALLTQIPDLFDQLLQYENDRAAAGIDTPSFVIQDTIDQIDQFLAGSKEDNLLIHSFDERIEAVDGLSLDQKKTYTGNNQALYNQLVLPAYQSLREKLTERMDADSAPDSSYKGRVSGSTESTNMGKSTGTAESDNPEKADNARAIEDNNGTTDNTGTIEGNNETTDNTGTIEGNNGTTDNAGTIEDNTENTDNSGITDSSAANASKERLCQYEGGKEFYQLLLKSNVGTDRSPEECIRLLEKQLEEIVGDIARLNADHPDLYTEYLAARPALTDPEKILSELESDIRIEFPEIADVALTLKDLPPTLSGTTASAFYLVPPLDSKEANIIYINRNRVDSQDLFSTLAHEGYPGHLYQTNYYMSTDPDPLRCLLRTGGYDEGWGTYAQLYSYNYIHFEDVNPDTEETLRQLLRDNDLLALTLSSLGDLYVNVRNYDRSALGEYLKKYGVSEESADSIYRYVVENPTTYLTYCVGYYEIDQLMKDTAKEEGDTFDIREFHKALLDTGSCPFSILQNHI